MNADRYPEKAAGWAMSAVKALEHDEPTFLEVCIKRSAYAAFRSLTSPTNRDTVQTSTNQGGPSG